MMCVAINVIPHMLNIWYYIFLSVQLLLSAIHGLFLSIMGDPLIHFYFCFKLDLLIHLNDIVKSFTKKYFRVHI